LTAERAVKFCLAILAGLLASGAAAQAAASCRGHGSEVVAAIKSRVEALRLLERETADRVLGLDTRTFDYLAAQARAAASVIADPAALVEEFELRRCRNLIAPVREGCAQAALQLLSIIEQHAAGGEPRALKEAYAQAMPRCERHMNLPPLRTSQVLGTILRS
jgi:hypothetical protein